MVNLKSRNGYLNFREKWHASGYTKKTADLSYTLPETNIASENGWLEDYFPIGEAYFRGCGYVSFREGIYFAIQSHPPKDVYRFFVFSL